MLFFGYAFLILKQITRMKSALFFTLFFPVILYVFYGFSASSFSLIVFINFAMQSAMLQTVGIFVSIQKNTPWGNYLSTLPAPPIYPALGIILAMMIVGLLGISLIGIYDYIFFHNLNISSILLALAGAIAGAFPMGSLGYLIGKSLDIFSARNVLVLVNLALFFMACLPKTIASFLAWFSLPNVWIEFSKQLALTKSFNVYYFSVLLAYFLLFCFLIRLNGVPKGRYE